MTHCTFARRCLIPGCTRCYRTIDQMRADWDRGTTEFRRQLDSVRVNFEERREQRRQAQLREMQRLAEQHEREQRENDPNLN